MFRKPAGCTCSFNPVREQVGRSTPVNADHKIEITRKIQYAWASETALEFLKEFHQSFFPKTMGRINLLFAQP